MAAPVKFAALSQVADKWRAFGWTVTEVDGHNHQQIADAVQRGGQGRPHLIAASTIKGKGVSFMEDQLIWHYYVVTQELLEQALEELR